MPAEGPSSSRRLPSFIIAGAAKSGTSTLHAMLAAHPDVYIPEHEIYFFSIDDFQQHPEFFADRGGNWVDRDYDAHGDAYLDWYQGFFAEAPPNAMLGDDSTSYLASRRAAGRIRALLPDAKLIFLLRDPAARTYSQYWHDLRVGRIVEDFEATLRHAPGTLMQRSLYREQVVEYLERFPREQLLFLLFEDLAQEPRAVLDIVTRFLGLPPAGDDVDASAMHRNPARVPRSLRLQLWRNRIVRDRAAARFQGHLPGTEASTGLRERAVSGRWVRLNMRQDRRPPPMREATHRFLDEHFAHENAGLSDLIGRDVSRTWYRTAR
jgi:Sulfotransferase family